MTVGTLIGRLAWTPLALGLALVTPAPVQAHCDGLDGPVVKAAQQALEIRTPAPVLIWVQPKDEPEIRTVFEHTLAVRALGLRAKEMADRYFFETVVRVHRAGESAPFTGLQPAGRDLGPAIPAADEALDDGSIEPVVTLLTRAMQARLQEQFRAASTAKAFDPDDVAAGREYVKAYVEFIHFVERLYEASTTSPHGDFVEPELSASHR